MNNNIPTKNTKLLAKASRTFLFTSATLMLIGTVILYFYTKQILNEEVEEELFSTEARIESILNLNNNAVNVPPAIEVKEVVRLRRELLKDTLIFDPSQNEIELFRELTIYKNINGINYRITVRNLVVESKDILIPIIASYVIILFFSFKRYQ